MHSHMDSKDLVDLNRAQDSARRHLKTAQKEFKWAETKRMGAMLAGSAVGLGLMAGLGAVVATAIPPVGVPLAIAGIAAGTVGMAGGVAAGAWMGHQQTKDSTDYATAKLVEAQQTLGEVNQDLAQVREAADQKIEQQKQKDRELTIKRERGREKVIAQAKQREILDGRTPARSPARTQSQARGER